MKRWWNLRGHQLTIPPDQTEIPSKAKYVYYFRSLSSEQKKLQVLSWYMCLLTERTFEWKFPASCFLIAPTVVSRVTYIEYTLTFRSDRPAYQYLNHIELAVRMRVSHFVDLQVQRARV